MKPLQANQVMFAVSEGEGDKLDVLLGLPAAAWEHMKNGNTHTFDLTKLGLPIRIIMFGGADHATLKGWIDAHNRSLGITGEIDLSGQDFSI